MAEKEYKAVAKLFLETKDANKDADAFCKDLKRKLGEIESAADKMTAFKDLASYIEAADKRLAEFKANNQDAFNNMFDGMDASLKVVFENIFKISKDKLVELNNISDQLKNKTADTIDPAALKEWEKSVKGIYALLNEKSGISGHGKIETRFQRLQEAVTNFATVWKGVTDTLSNGFGAGGIASGIQRSPQDIQTELDRLDQQNVRLGKIQQEFQKIKADFDKLNDGENVFFSSDTKFDLSDIKTLVSVFKQAKKTFDNFEGDKNSIEYYEIVLKYMQQAAKLKGMYEALTLNPNEANKEIMKQLKKMPGKKEKETQADILGDVVDKADSALSDGLLESLTKFDKGPLSDLFAQIDSQMTTLEDEIEKLNQATGNVGVGFDKMGQHAVSATEYIRGMTIAIKEMFDALSQASDAEYKVLISGQDISIKRGQNKKTSSKTTAEAYLANIMQDIDVDAHTHQGLIADINVPDFKQAIQRQYAGLAKMSAIIGDKDIVTLDLAKVKAEDAYTALNKLKELTNTKGKQSLDVNEFNKIFTDINPEYTNIAKKWDPSKFSDLATYIFNVKQSAQQAFDPVQRLQNLLIAISGKQIDFSKYEDLFKTLSVNNVGDIFNQIAKAEDIKEDGQILQVQDIASGSVQDVVADIQKQKDAFLELRQTAGVTYEEIAQAAKEYSNVYNKAEGQNFEFFKKYFHASEIDEIQKKFMDLGDGFRDLDGLTKELAMEFGIDPDEIESFNQAGNTVQGVSEQLKSFYDLVDEIRNKSFDVAGDATDNLEIGIYIERLNSAKAALDELGDQGQLTAEQMNQVNNAFNAANMSLDTSTAHYSEYGYGRYDYSYYEEYEDARRENDELRQRNSELENQLKNRPNISQQNTSTTAGNETQLANGIQAEAAQLEELLKAITAVKYAVEAKTAAFREEAGVVDSVVKQEITSLGNLKTYLESLQIIVQNLFNGTNKKFGLHYGNLDYYSRTGQKSETFSDQRTSLSYGNWGSFGTGIYYATNPNDFASISTNGQSDQQRNKKFYAIDLSKYNLYMAQTSEQAESLYNFLNKLQKFVLASSGYTGFDKELEGIDVNTLYSEFQTVFKNISLPITGFENFINRMKTLVPAIDKNINTNSDAVNNIIDGMQVYLRQSDNIPTMFMKELGYQGIDVGGTSWDGFKHGSVIYDLDRGSPYIKSFDTANELIEFCNNSLTQTNNVQNSIGSSVLQWKNDLNTILETINFISISMQGSSSVIQSISNALSEIVTNAQMLKNNLSGINDIQVGDIVEQKTVQKEDKSKSDVIQENTKPDYTIPNTTTESETAQLDTLLEKINAVKDAVGAKTQAFETERTTVDTVVAAEIESLKQLEEYLTTLQNLISNIFTGESFKVEGIDNINNSGNPNGNTSMVSILQTISGTLDSIYGVLQGFTGIEADNKNSIKQKEPVVDSNINQNELSEKDSAILSSILDAVKEISNYLATYKSNDVLDGVDQQNDSGYALEATLQNVKGVLDNILSGVNKDDSLSTLVEPLSAAVASLKDVANGIIQHQKAQKSDTSVAQAKIADPIQQDLIRQKAQDAVQSLGTEVKIASLKALADGLVRVSGAVKKASGEWEGFTVKVNEADKAVGLVVDDQSEYAKSLNKASKQVNDNSIFKSEAGKQVGKFDLDRVKLQKDVNIPDSFKQQIQDARTAIANAADEDALKIAINNWEALKNQIHAAAVEQDLYIEKSKNTNTAPDQFTKDLRSQKTSFGKYKRDTEDAIDVTDELKQRLKDLEAELANINDSSGLRAWQKKFNGLKSEITAAQSSYKRDKNTYSQQIMGQANAGLKSAGIKRDSTNLTEDQQKIIDKYKELEKQIGEYNDKVSTKQQAETSGIEQTKAALLDLIATYKQANNIVDAKGNPSRQAYGTAQVQNFNAKYNSLQTRAKNVGLTDDFVAVQNLANAYEKLKEAQAKFKVGEDLTTDAGKAKVEAFKQAQIECNRYAKELNRVVTESEKLQSNSVDASPVSENFQDTMQGRKRALKEFINVIPDTAIGKFNADFTELTYTVKNGDGTFTNMTATLNAARDTIFATAGETEKATTAFGRFWGELKGKARGIATYLLSMTGFQEIWQQIKQGIQYVREIDSALTELKKVTNGTNATYDAFLQTMSKTAGAIGSTVSELTTMAAEWGRLGYSLEEAGKLAESTAILLNVSEFENATDASQALISTMQAFGYVAEDSLDVVDILNEVKVTCLLIQ